MSFQGFFSVLKIESASAFRRNNFFFFHLKIELIMDKYTIKGTNAHAYGTCVYRLRIDIAFEFLMPKKSNKQILIRKSQEAYGIRWIRRKNKVFLLAYALQISSFLSFEAHSEMASFE